MLVPEEKLAIQIAQIDGIKVDNMDFAEAGKEEVFEQFAANPTSSDHKNTRLRETLAMFVRKRQDVRSTCLMVP